MANAEMTATPEALAVGGPAAAMAVRTFIVTAVVFTVCAVLSTQVRAIRAGSPWQSDPYDMVVSFTQFLVPALTVLIVLRSWLCRRYELLPLFRADQLVRATVVGTVMIAGTATTDWVAVAARADHELWNSRTPWLITTLVLLSLLALANFLLQWQAFPPCWKIAVPPTVGTSPASDGPRRAVHIAVVAGALGLPISMALRDGIWSTLGRCSRRLGVAAGHGLGRGRSADRRAHVRRLADHRRAAALTLPQPSLRRRFRLASRRRAERASSFVLLV